MIIAHREHVPRIAPSAYIQASAQVIGDVEIGAESSVWFNVVIRADVYPIRIGARTNIQDNSTIHVTGGRFWTVVGDEVTVGHGVILHGCRVADRCLIGIGSILLDGVEIEADCLVAAGSLVAPGTRIPAGHLAKGSPAKVARPLRPEELAHLKESAANYVAHAAAYRVAREA
jgi:carbonic anhydrase/acetyltransferase-like protein (isoleucine patch superfamily)